MIIAVVVIAKLVKSYQYGKLEAAVLGELGFSNWDAVSYFDAFVTVKSRQTLGNYDKRKYFLYGRSYKRS